MRGAAPTPSFEGCYPCPGIGHPFPSSKSQAHICAQTEVTTIPSWHAGILWDIVQGVRARVKLKVGVRVAVGIWVSNNPPTAAIKTPY